MNEEALRKEIGARIKAGRKGLDYTQERFARLVNMSRAALANIETGRQNLVVPQVYAIAEKLKLSVAELLPSLDSTSHQENLPIPQDLEPKLAAQVAQVLADPKPSQSHPKDAANVEETSHTGGRGTRRTR